jgi:ABC-2 type transport system permease protein
MSQLAESVIHDLGYQRYAGARLGRGYAARSLYAQSLRTAYGLGRGMKSKIFPWSIVGLVGLVVAAIAAIQALTGDRVGTYPKIVGGLTTLAVLFVATVAGELLSRDLAARVLPLYFSRPLRRSDYAVAKVGAVATATALLLGVPQFLIFAADAFATNKGLRGVLDEAGRLGTGLIFAVLTAAVVASIGSFCAALTGRRAFAAVAVVAVFLVPRPVALILGGYGVLVSPADALGAVREWLFEDVNGGVGPASAVVLVGLIGTAVAGTILRYRRVS